MNPKDHDSRARYTAVVVARVPREQRAQLASLAKRDEVSESTVVRRAIALYLEHRGRTR